MRKEFCTECEKPMDYIVRVKHNVSRLVGGKIVVMKNLYICTCKNCGNIITVREYEEKNENELKKAEVVFQNAPRFQNNVSFKSEVRK